MPWRLVQFIILFAILLLFIIFNLGEPYRCDINFGFTKIKDVPVFLTAFFAFFAGMLCTLPFLLSGRVKKKPKNDPKKGLLGKMSRKKGTDLSSSKTDDNTGGSPLSPNSSPYGID